MTALNSRKNSRTGGGSGSGFTMPMSNSSTNRLAATSVSANNLLDLSPMSRSSPCQMMENAEPPDTGDPNGNIKLRNSAEQFTRGERNSDSQSLQHKQFKGDLVPLLDTQTAVSGSTTIVSAIPATGTNSANCISANSKPNICTHPLVSHCQVLH